MNLTDILALLENVRNGTAKCPAHEDNKNSLSITEKDNKILLHCHAGCKTEDICAALGLTVKDLFTDIQEKPRILKTYDYTDADGNLLYQAVRMIPKDFRQRRPDGQGGWIWNLKGIKQVLYRLPKLISCNKTILIVEGEKDVETLEKLGFTATCNSCGAGKFPSDSADLFNGKGVVIIPDNDKPGLAHAEKICTILQGHAREIRVVILPRGKDVSDSNYTRDEIINLIKNTEAWKPAETVYVEPAKPPFRILGYNDGYYYYLPGEDMQIIKFSAEQHSPSNLISIAPLNWWETSFPAKMSADWSAAKNYLFRQSKKLPIYDTRRLRGCGTWFDNGKVVQHNGDRLIVDGELISIDNFKTDNIYNKSYPIDIYDSKPITTAESQEFLKLCKLFTWDKRISGTFLSGFCVIAPICGALSWRPHVWLTGASGTGKSWIMKNIVSPVIGKIALKAQSNTSAAGLYQTLGINALPIIFDEAEGETPRARDELQKILELMRQASTESGTPILKGSQSGHAVEYRVRSCFILSSIGVNISQKADLSRITPLSLLKSDSTEKFKEITDITFNLLTPEYCSGLRARTLKLIPIILKNTEIFSRIVAEKFRDQRIGDQFGSLLSGAYSLADDGLIDIEKAKKWVDSQDWEDQVSGDTETDETNCLNRILEYIITVIDTGNQRREYSISEILNDPDLYLNAEIKKSIERIGLKVLVEYDKDFDKTYKYLLVADSHRCIKKILSGEIWEKNWSRILRRIPGAEQKKPVKFAGNSARSTKIPFDFFMKND